jgi:hypothetical protein
MIGRISKGAFPAFEMNVARSSIILLYLLRRVHPASHWI